MNPNIIVNSNNFITEYTKLRLELDANSRMDELSGYLTAEETQITWEKSFDKIDDFLNNFKGLGINES